MVNVSCQGQIKAGLELDSLQWEKKQGLGNWEEMYNTTKLMNVLFSQELAARWADVGVTSFSLHPGLVRTDIFRNLSPTLQNLRYILALVVGKSCAQGAQTSLYLCSEPGLECWSGKFFSDCRVQNSRPSKVAEDQEMAAKLWTRSEELVKLK